MSEADRIKWNEKFGSRGLVPGLPEPFLVENHELRDSGLVLDLACGDGRNSLFLAQGGHPVLGVDLSDTALERLRSLSVELALSIKLFQMDLEEAPDLTPLPPFEHVVIMHYKPVEGLWEQLVKRISTGGKILACTFNHGQHECSGFPKRFCLQEREYFDLHPELKVEKYQSREDQGKFTDGYVLRKL